MKYIGNNISKLIIIISIVIFILIYIKAIPYHISSQLGNNELYNLYDTVYYGTIEKISEKTVLSGKVFDNSIDAQIGEKLFIYPNDNNHIINIGRLNCEKVEIEFDGIGFKNRDIQYAHRFISLEIVWNEKLCDNWGKHVK